MKAKISRRDFLAECGAVAH
ncbi:twin-arginine translocation signal domain-containing protein [Caulobacter segnis]